MIRILHIITDLDTGGAEMMLYKLVSTLDKKNFRCRVVSIASPGVLSNRIRDLDVRVDSLNVDPRHPHNPLALFRVFQIMRRWNPHVVQTWMYHADLLGTVARAVSGKGTLIWNMRCTNMDFSRYRWMTRWVMKTCAVLSSIPCMVVANSHASIEHHRNLGYHPKRWMVISNGFDLERFKPDPVLRRRIRKELQVPANAPAVGLVARVDPMKDHATFFSAAKIVGACRPDTHFMLCGEGVTWNSRKLLSSLGDRGDVLNLHLLGRREDVPQIMAGLDLLVLTSAYGESFPNVIGEAMACGVPCVVTDVGDSARIVADTGMVVSPGDTAAIARAVIRLLSLSPEARHGLGISARKRIQEHYALEKVAKVYERLYLKAAMQGDTHRDG